MASRATYISFISLLLINHLKGQTGEGCYLKTCTTPGQVRINAKFDATSGAFLGGCNCGCPPEMADPQSPQYCGAPRTVNYDTITLQGDCSCSCPPETTTPPESCVYPAIYDPTTCDCGCPSWAPQPSDCPAHQIFLPEICSCGCSIGGIGKQCTVNGEQLPGSFVTADCTCDTTLVTCPGNQIADITGKCGCPDVAPNGLYLPACELPLVKDPMTCDCVTTTTTLPPIGPATVTCESVGDCGCPWGTRGTCTIHCDVGNDACKDGLVECNNDGYDCIVNCMTGSACAGAANIMGPAEGTLTVNCIGGQSCEGATTFNGELARDVTVLCEGSQSCKGSTSFIGGSGYNKLSCIGSPDSCAGMGTVTIPANAMAFECIGDFCPGAAPANFDNTPVMPVQQPSPPQLTNAGYPNNNVLPHLQTDPPIVTMYGGIVIPQTPVVPGVGTGTGTGPSPGGPAGGGTLVINPNPPIPIVLPDEIVICEGIGKTCDCSGTRTCTIKCEQQDDCKEAILNCPPDHDCTVVCTGDASCIVSTINAPIGKDFTLNCAGISSCVDSKIFSENAMNVAHTCSGKDACKGATTINCGTGSCEIACPGESACDSASINTNSAHSFACSGASQCPPDYTAPPIAVPTAMPTAPTSPCAGHPECLCNGALQCFSYNDPAENCGCVCPLNILQQEAMGNAASICGPQSPGQVYISSACGCDCPAGTNTNCPAGQVFNQDTCSCECPGGNECPGASIMNMETCMCQCPPSTPTISDCSAVGKVLRNCECQCQTECPGTGQIQSPLTCGCACPVGTPAAHECASGVLDELLCECAAPEPSSFCCHPQIDGFKPWRGRCWGRTSEEMCNAEPNSRCVWKGDTLNGVTNPAPNCLVAPPHNDLLPNQACLFRDGLCTTHAQCCSEVCRVTGQCR